jgi:hypothetical protein
VAIDPLTDRCLWKAPPTAFKECAGVALLHGTGLFAASCLSGRVHMHRVSDGERIASSEVEEPSFVAYFEPTSTLYVASRRAANSGHGVVFAIPWKGDAFGVPTRVATIAEGQYSRPLAVFPVSTHRIVHRGAAAVVGTSRAASLTASAGAASSAGTEGEEVLGHLLVGTFFKNDITIVSLPSHAVVAQNVVPWPQHANIVGITADPSGAAVAISVRDYGVCIESWPELLVKAASLQEQSGDKSAQGGQQ